MIPATPSIAQLAEIMRQHAETERDRLLQHPSLKWTWGVNVEEADLQGMFRAGDRNYLLPHTGYDSSLPGNVEAGEWSETASHPRSADRQYHTHALSKDIPLHFHKYPLRRNDYVKLPSGHLPSGSVASSHTTPKSDAATTPAKLEAGADIDGDSCTSSVLVSAAVEALELPHPSATSAVAVLEASPHIPIAFQIPDLMNPDHPVEGDLPGMMPVAPDEDPFLDSVCPMDVFEELAKLDSLDEPIL